MTTLELKVVLTFDNGWIDAEYIRQSVDEAIDQFVAMGLITPHPTHATLTGVIVILEGIRP